MTEYKPMDLSKVDIGKLRDEEKQEISQTHYTNNRNWLLEHTDTDTWWIYVGSQTGTIYSKGTVSDRIPEELQVQEGDIPIYVEKQYHDTNKLNVSVRALDKFDKDDDGFLGNVALWYLPTKTEGSHMGGFIFRNARYADLVEAEQKRDAKEHGVDLPITWSKEALDLKRSRNGLYLLEDPWTLEEAQKELESRYHWSLHLNNPGFHNMRDFASRETAEFIIRQELGDKADKILEELRHNGLDALRDEELHSIFGDMISSIQFLRSDGEHKGMSYFDATIVRANRNIGEYEALCSELGVDPLQFDFTARLESLRKQHGTKTPFKEAAEVLVDTMRNLGKDSLHARAFDVEISGDHATVKSRSYIRDEKVSVEL